MKLPEKCPICDGKWIGGIAALPFRFVCRKYDQCKTILDCSFQDAHYMHRSVGKWWSLYWNQNGKVEVRYKVKLIEVDLLPFDIGEERLKLLLPYI